MHHFPNPDACAFRTMKSHGVLNRTPGNWQKREACLPVARGVCHPPPLPLTGCYGGGGGGEVPPHRRHCHGMRCPGSQGKGAQHLLQGQLRGSCLDSCHLSHPRFKDCLFLPGPGHPILWGSVLSHGNTGYFRGRADFTHACLEGHEGTQTTSL